MVSKEALQNVDRLKEKAHFKTKRLTAEIPECLEEKQDQIDSLEKTVTVLLVPYIVKCCVFMCKKNKS